MSSSEAGLLCSTRGCPTGQDVGVTGRKVVSDFFGRNKRQTKEIPLTVWHLACRKHYQRGAYAAKVSGESTERCRYYLDQLNHQLDRIALWRPDATFTIQLQRPAKARLTRFQDVFRRNGGDQDAAELAVAVVPKTNSKGESVPLSNADAVQMGHAEHIDANFCGRDQAIQHVQGTIMPWIDGEISNGNMVSMPPIEFLVDAPSAGETINDPSTNYARWIAHCDGMTYTPLDTPARPVTPSSKKRTLKLHGPQTLKKSPSVSAPPEVTRSGFRITIKNGKVTSSPSSSSASSASASSAGPSKKRKASESPDLEQPTSAKKPAIQTPSATMRPRRTPEEINRIMDSIPLYEPPPPPSSTVSKKRPAPLDLSAISHNATAADMSTINSATSESDSVYTTVESSPIRARGMIFAGAKSKRLLREAGDDDDDDDGDGTDDTDDDEPIVKRRKTSAA